MDFETRKIYKALGNFKKVEGIDDLIDDMTMLNNRISEYKNMYRLNSYSVPSIIPTMESTKKDIEHKYKNYFSSFNATPSYSINVFGMGGDCYERELESSLSKLGKIAVAKICDHYNIAYDKANLYGANNNTSEYFKKALMLANENILEEKMNFKINF